MSEKVTSPLWNALKVLAAVIPSFSLVMACLYYAVFFSNFEGLELNILTVSDYFNKSVEFIPLALFICFGLLFALIMYPPRLKGETEEKHYDRIGGSTKVWGRMDKVFLILLFTFIPLVILLGLTTSPFHEFVQVYPTMFMFYIVFFVNKMAKHFPIRLVEVIYTRLNLLLFIGIFMGTNNVVSNAYQDAGKLRNPDSEVSFLVDIIDAGYLKKKSKKLILEDKNSNEVTSFQIVNFDKRSVFCRAGFGFACAKENRKK